MSSIDWQRLVEEHDRAPERDDDEWLEALMAMDEDPAERVLAEEADPLLMFRRLPAPEIKASDIESMKAAVKNMREVSETLAENSPAPRSRRLARWALPLAALLVLAMTAVILGGLGHGDTPSPVVVAELAGAELPVSEFASSGVRPARFVSAAGDLRESTIEIDTQIDSVASLAAFDLPLIEDSDPGSDLLMQIENDDLSLVVVLTGQDV